MEAFVKCTDSANWNILLGRRNTSNNFYFGINAGKFRWDFFNGSSAVGTVTGATTLSTNTVYHLCAIRTISDNKLYLFVDGHWMAAPFTRARAPKTASILASVTIGAAPHAISGAPPTGRGSP